MIHCKKLLDVCALSSIFFEFQAGGCDLWKWYEDNMTTPFIAELLRDLCDAVRALKKENKTLEAGIVAAENAAQNAVQNAEQKLYEEIAFLKNQVAENEARNAILVASVKALEKERVVLRILIVVCIAVVVGLIFSS